MTGQAMTVIPGATRVPALRVRDAARRRRNPELPRGRDRRRRRRRDRRDASRRRRCALRARSTLLALRKNSDLRRVRARARVRITAVSPASGCGCGAWQRRTCSEAPAAGAGEPDNEETMSYITNLKCRECGQEYPISPLHVCETCFGPLEVTYDYAQIRAALTRARYREAGAQSVALSRIAAGRFQREPDIVAPTPASLRCCTANGSAPSSASSISI